MRIATEQRRTSTARRGTLIVELLLVAPIFVVLLTAMIEFSMILTARQELLAASREGCRVAAHGAPNEEVRAAVACVLGDSRLREAEVRIKHFEENHVLPHAPRDRVQVVIHIPTTCVVPDFLGLVGISFAEDELACCTVMSMETLVPCRRAHDKEDEGRRERDSEGRRER
jgi:hypothetical protein